MEIIIVNNPNQLGATDGAVAIIKSLAAKHPELKIKHQVVDRFTEVSGRPDVVCSVGSETADLATQIYMQRGAKRLIGIKDPHKRSFPALYDAWDIIIDTMDSMKDSPVTKVRKDLVHVPELVPFSLTRQDLENVKKSDWITPAVGILIGGADPYTGLDLECQDVDYLFKVGEYLRGSGSVCVVGGKRTSPKIAKALIDLVNGHDNWKFYDYRERTLYTEDIDIKIENPYFEVLSESDIIIATDDSLSMMCEATVAQKKMLLYNTYNTCRNKDIAKRRLDVCEAVKKHSGVSSFSCGYEVSELPKLLTCSAKSLEGVADSQLADLLYEKVIKELVPTSYVGI